MAALPAESKIGDLMRPAAWASATLAPLNTTTLEVGWSTRYNTGRLEAGSSARARLAKTTTTIADN